MSLAGLDNDHLDDHRDVEAPAVWLYHCPNGDCRMFCVEWDTSMSPPEHRILTGEPPRCGRCLAVAAFRFRGAS